MDERKTCKQRKRKHKSRQNEKSCFLFSFNWQIHTPSTLFSLQYRDSLCADRERKKNDRVLVLSIDFLRSF